MLKPCLDCQIEYAIKSRCPMCQSQYEIRRGTTSQRGYGSKWQRLVATHIKNNPMCVLCGSNEDLTGDHIIPLSRGGSSTRENIRTLCRRCNSAKGNRIERR